MDSVQSARRSFDLPPHPQTIIEPAITKGQVVALVNPAARLTSGDESDSGWLERELQARGLNGRAITTQDEAEAIAVTSQAVRAGAAMVIAVGGDGAVHAAVEGLLRDTLAKGISENKAPRQIATALGILPSGTMNNVAASLGIPENPSEALDIIAGGKTRPLDVGVAEGRPFIEVVTLGAIAALAPIGESFKGHPWTLGRNLIAALEVLHRARPRRVRLTIDGKEYRVRALHITIDNTPAFGAHLLVAPEARMDDGLLEVVVFEGPTGWDLVRYLATTIGGVSSRGQHPREKRFQGHIVRVAPQESWPVELDGSHFGYIGVGTTMPVFTAQALHGVLRVCAPPRGENLPETFNENPVQTLMRALPTATTPPSMPDTPL